MKAPKDHWVIQIEVTNACVRYCSNCTRICGHHAKPFFMDYETFCKAVDSVIDHPGLIGVMGGEPTLHPRFADMCQYLYEKLPAEKKPAPGSFTFPTDSFVEVRRRYELDEYEIYPYKDGPRPIIQGAGLWTSMTNKYLENYEIIQDVFRFQNLNDHANISYHQPVLISRKDLGVDDETWHKLRENCWVNRQWSSSVTPKGCFFCEVAAAMDMLYDGPGGLPIEPGWWKRDIEDFKDQFHWCELCGIPLKTFARDARQGIVDVSPKHYELLKTKETAKFAPDKLNLVEIRNGEITEESKRTALDYHGSAYIGDAQDRVSQQTPIYAERFVGVVLCEDAADLERYTKNLAFNNRFLSELYAVCDSKVEKIGFSGESLASRGPVGEFSFESFLEKWKKPTYFIFFTPEVRFGRGIARMKRCVVNPGTLHMVDLSRKGTGKNPYIANAEELDSGICALLNNRALALKNIDLDMPLDWTALWKLWEAWDPKKRIELSAAMDGAMLGVRDRKNRGATKLRQTQAGWDFVKRNVRQHGLLRTSYYGAFLLHRYGMKVSMEKLKRRIF